MEKYKPMPMPMPMPMPITSPVSQMPINMPAPAPMPMTMPSHHINAPITLHASYEEVNIFEPKKHHHHHGHCHKPTGWMTSVGTILVLYILLVIILRGTCK